MNQSTQARALLRDLCGIYSPSGREAEAVHFMVDRATSLGMRASVDAVGNFIAERGSGERTIVLLGHIDTVPGFIEPRVEGGTLYARGAVDAKGPLATFVTAASRVAHLDGIRLVVIGAVEEEAPGSRGAHYVVDQYRPETVIIGEPSGVTGITVGYKGRVTVRVHANQPHAHTAAPDRSVAARAAEFWARLEGSCGVFNAGKRLFDRIDPHLAEFHTTTDGFVDVVDLRGSLRLPLDYPLRDLEQQLHERARHLGTVTLEDHVPPFKSDRRNHLVRALLLAIRHEGLDATFKLKTGTSDMNVVGPVWNCPIVAYGPGDSRLDHTPDEHIVFEDYLKAIAIVTRALDELVSRPGKGSRVGR